MLLIINYKIMRVFLSVLILIFSLQSLIKADDIRDFEIEGMSIGDSLLDYFSKNEIKENTENYYDNFKSNKYYVVEIYEHKNFEVYESIQLSLKTNDKNYIIYHIVGLVFYPTNINHCYDKQKEISNELMYLFKNIEKKDRTTIHPGDATGKSTVNEINFWFKSGDVAAVDCYDWSEHLDWTDHLRVGMLSNDFNIWLTDNLK